MGYICTCVCMSTRVDVPPFPYLGNAWKDCAEIRSRGWRHISQFFIFKSQGWGTAARADVRTPFSDLGNGWTDCAEIWFVVRHQLAWRFTKVNEATGARTHDFSVSRERLDGMR